MPNPGESVRWKTFRRNWLGGNAKWFCLIALTDEATGRTVARFTSEDSLRENLSALAMYVSKWGRPRRIRTDRSTLFVGSEDSKQVRNGQSQIRRALAELDIEWTPAHSPRDLGGAAAFTAEVRRNLSGELEAAGAGSFDEAVAYLDGVFLPRWNSTNASSSDGVDAHAPMPPEHDLESILATVHFRTVSEHGTFRLNNTLYRFSGLAELGGLAGKDVRVETRADGSVLARWHDAYVNLEPVADDFEPPAPLKPAHAAPKPRTTNRAWMKGFFDTPIAPIWRRYK